jgi:pimeloyl-ACP methyl ester carboxylesterase
MPEHPTAGQLTFRYSETVLINYETNGTGPTPVVFLHGFAAALTTWDDIRPLLPCDDYRCYFLDLKGFGCSSKPHDGAYGPADQAAVVMAFLKDRKLRNVLLVGHSLGGGIALITLLEALSEGRKGLIGGLVLIDCAAYPRKLPPILRLLCIPLLGWAILNLLPVPFMVRFTLMRIFHNRSAVTPERIARYVDSYTGKGIARSFTESARQFLRVDYDRFIPSYRQLGLPVLIVWGRYDPIIPVEDGLRLHRNIPGSRLVVIDECGHNPHEEKAAETCAAMTDFLAHFFSAAD